MRTTPFASATALLLAAAPAFGQSAPESFLQGQWRSELLDRVDCRDRPPAMCEAMQRFAGGDSLIEFTADTMTMTLAGISQSFRYTAHEDTKDSIVVTVAVTGEPSRSMTFMRRGDKLCLDNRGKEECAVRMQPPIIGRWEWNPLQGVCREEHTYALDGSASSSSGEEVLMKTWTATPASDGMYRVVATVVESNGKQDCTGSTTAVGATSTVYIQPTNVDGYYTCASEDGMSCYGSARRVTPGKNP